jgi:hypothetical protein
MPCHAAITHLLAQRLGPHCPTALVSFSPRVGPVVAKDDDTMRRAVPCFVQPVLQPVVLRPEAVQDDQYRCRGTRVQQPREEPHCGGMQRGR